MCWPPATNGMSANQLATLLLVAKDCIEHTARELKIQCKKEGHVWNNNAGVRSVVHNGGTWIEPSEDVFCDTGHWRGGEYVTYYVRTCTRCGEALQKQGITTISSPYE